MKKFSVLPIVGYGHHVLRDKAKEVSKSDPCLKDLIPKMFVTMYGANGVGLAAPQIGKSLRLFLIDASGFAKNDDLENDVKEELGNFKGVFINPTILEETGEPWEFSEGCLSIPKINETVLRKPVIRVKYQDENFQWHEKNLKGVCARIFQHEYDHLNGVLFIDKITPLKKQLLKRKLEKLIKGKITPDYPMVFVT